MLLLQLLPYLPSVVRTVEEIHGGPESTGKGAQKLNTAIDIVTKVVPAVADSISQKPENQTHLVTVINAVVAGLNASGVMKQPVRFQPVE